MRFRVKVFRPVSLLSLILHPNFRRHERIPYPACSAVYVSVTRSLGEGFRRITNAANSKYRSVNPPGFNAACTTFAPPKATLKLSLICNTSVFCDTFAVAVGFAAVILANFPSSLRHPSGLASLACSNTATLPFSMAVATLSKPVSSSPAFRANPKVSSARRSAWAENSLK